ICPAPGSPTKRDPGSFSCSLAMAVGVAPSFSPTMNSVGHFTLADRRCIVMGGKRCGAADEAVNRSGADHRANFVEMRRIAGDCFRRKPARDGWLDQSLDALLRRRRDPFFPLLARLRR